MQNLTFKQIVYLLLAILGVVWTWYFNLQLETGLVGFFTSMFDSPITGSLAADVSVALMTWLVWMIPEARRLGISWWTVALLIVLTFVVAFAFTFPLFMFIRERILDQSKNQIVH